jgi:DNA methylase
MPGSHLVLRGDARRIPIADGSVSLIVTSPPYWAQRSYRDAGGHYDGQIGSEPHPRFWLEAMWEVMKECWRVLDDQGSVFVNLGDKRAGSGGHNNRGVSKSKGSGSTLAEPQYSDKPLAREAPATRRNAPDRYEQAHFGRRKSRQLLPERFAIGCEDGLADPEGIGWIVRQVMIWCLSGGTRVYARTPTGDRPIMLRDLYRAYRPENVQLWNGQRWTQVQGWSQTPAPGDALEIELRSGQRIGCTRNHQWPTARGLFRADELTIGDVIDSTRLPQPSPASRAGWPRVGWFVGMYLAEGSRSETTIQIAGHAKETGRGDRLKLLAREFDGSCHRYQSGPNKVTDNLHGPILSGILDNFVSGRNAHDKRLTMRVWQQSDEFLDDLLMGYLEGDGHYDAKNDRWRLGFCENDELAADLRTLCARLGVSIRLKRCQVQGFGKWYPSWRGSLRMTKSVHRNAKPDTEVVAIRASRARYFYDVGVADDPHIFSLACGVLTHNSKPNGLPESVTDRFRDNWESIYHFTKSERYFAAIDEIREQYSPGTAERYESGYTQIKVSATGQTANPVLRADGGGPSSTNPLGKVPGSVWRIASEPLRIPDYFVHDDRGWRMWGDKPYGKPRKMKDDEAPEGLFALSDISKGMKVVPELVGLWRYVERRLAEGYECPVNVGSVDHFAAYPTSLPERIIKGFSPSGICTTCNEPRRPVVEKRLRERNRNVAPERYAVNPPDGATPADWYANTEFQGSTEATITGYACRCPGTLAPTRPSVVLDVFGGSGTTALVAETLGRTGISLDLSSDYCHLARWRIEESGHGRKTEQRTWGERQGTLL